MRNTKNLILITIGLLNMGMTSYATTFMRIKTTDGDVARYDVKNVVEVNFEGEQEDSSEHKYVDLGLPSRTLWATCNIGATRPEESGDFFAWGEIEPKKIYNWSTYKWGVASDSLSLVSLTKYNFGNKYSGTLDSRSTLLPEDDAATVNWGEEWRMPTLMDIQELLNNCKYTWTEYEGVKGTKFTAPNGNYIFLPATGGRNGSEFYHVGKYGRYWTSSLYEWNEVRAYDLFVHFPEAGWGYGNERRNGFPIRPVRKGKEFPYTMSLKVKTTNGKITCYNIKNVIKMDFEEVQDTFLSSTNPPSQPNYVQDDEAAQDVSLSTPLPKVDNNKEIISTIGFTHSKMLYLLFLLIPLAAWYYFRRKRVSAKS